jgi:hypothetical protein
MAYMAIDSLPGELRVEYRAQRERIAVKLIGGSFTWLDLTVSEAQMLAGQLGAAVETAKASVGTGISRG